MPTNGITIGQVLRQLKEKYHVSFDVILRRLAKRAAEHGTDPPYQYPASISRVLKDERKAVRRDILQLLVWGYEVTDFADIEWALKVAGRAPATGKELEDLLINKQGFPTISPRYVGNGWNTPHLKFLRALNASEITEELLPEYRHEAVSCWRMLTQSDPGSIRILEAASEMGHLLSPGKRIAVVSISSALARAPVDGRVQSRAATITRRYLAEVTSSTVYGYPGYRLFRKYLYSAAEAGVYEPQRVVDFIHRHRHEWERRLNREYNEDPTDASFARSVAGKQGWPTAREEHTGIITDCQAELLPRDLLEKTYRMMQRSRPAAAVS